MLNVRALHILKLSLCVCSLTALAAVILGGLPAPEQVQTGPDAESDCTRGPGYWKTHSEYGPAPYDETWAALIDGADTLFFNTDQSYYEVAWTPPHNGNVYYILAHMYIAAELNVLSGASIPTEVEAALDNAGVMLVTHVPEDAVDFSEEQRAEWLALVDVLDDYNRGDVGPGKCADQQDGAGRG